MSVSMRLFKRVVVVVFSLCVVLAPIAVMGLAASILQPKLDMIELYRVSIKRRLGVLRFSLCTWFSVPRSLFFAIACLRFTQGSRASRA